VPKPYSPHPHRLERDLYAESSRITFITICAIAPHRPFVRPDFNRVLLDLLAGDQTRLNCTVFTYCLMPNHLHYLVKPNEDGVSVLTFTDQLKRKSTNAGWKHGWRGKLWQRDYYDHLVRHSESLLAIAQYILNNPVRKGLAATADEWPWSGHLNPLPA
jgi:REP element-mobilizing transposase RayT